MRPSRKPRVILILLIALCGLFVYSYTSRLVEMSQVEAKIAAMEARISEAKTEQYELLEIRDDLNRPDFVDRVAREYFDLAKPGDKVLVLIKEPADSQSPGKGSAAATASTSSDFRNLPVWQQWVVFFATEAYTLSHAK